MLNRASELLTQWRSIRERRPGAPAARPRRSWYRCCTRDDDNAAAGAPGRREPNSYVSAALTVQLRDKSSVDPFRHDRVSFVISLKPHDSTGPHQFPRQVANRTSPRFHHYLTPARFNARYGPTAADVSTVADFPRSEGLRVGHVSANRQVVDEWFGQPGDQGVRHADRYVSSGRSAVLREHHGTESACRCGRCGARHFRSGQPLGPAPGSRAEGESERHSTGARRVHAEHVGERRSRLGIGVRRLRRRRLGRVPRATRTIRAVSGPCRTCPSTPTAASKAPGPTSSRPGAFGCTRKSHPARIPDEPGNLPLCPP